MKKIILIIVGNIFLFLGIIGIFIPLLPTTPFILLSAACFLRSSERLYNWLTSHKTFGTYIKSYFKFRAIPFKTKLTAIVLLWIAMSFTVFVLIKFIWLKVLLLLLALGVTGYILSLKTLTKEMLEEFKEELKINASNSKSEYPHCE